MPSQKFDGTSIHCTLCSLTLYVGELGHVDGLPLSHYPTTTKHCGKTGIACLIMLHIANYRLFQNVLNHSVRVEDRKTTNHLVRVVEGYWRFGCISHCWRISVAQVRYLRIIISSLVSTTAPVRAKQKRAKFTDLLNDFPVTTIKENISSGIMKVIVAGATGAAGREAVKHCLADDRGTGVFILTRRALPDNISKHAKATVVIHEDFSSYPESILEQLAGAEICLW